jgi:cobalt/nickel transport system permease protein
MHIHEAVLSASAEGVVLLGVGAVVTAAGTAVGLRKMDYEQSPRVALLTSVFFVVSLVHVPVGLTSAHLVLSGLMGLLLGWAAFPAMLIALLLQALMFGHGGLLALGINTATMALPAVACHYAFRSLAASPREEFVFLAGFAAGGLATLLGALLTAGTLWMTGREFALLATAVVLFHLAVAVVEGVVTGSAVVLVHKVQPQLLLPSLPTIAHPRRMVDG